MLPKTPQQIALDFVEAEIRHDRGEIDLAFEIYAKAMTYLHDRNRQAVATALMQMGSAIDVLSSNPN
jgi:hypothetical protein